MIMKILPTNNLGSLYCLLRISFWRICVSLRVTLILLVWRFSLYLYYNQLRMKLDFCKRQEDFAPLYFVFVNIKLIVKSSDTVGHVF